MSSTSPCSNRPPLVLKASGQPPLQLDTIHHPRDLYHPKMARGRIFNDGDMYLLSLVIVKKCLKSILSRPLPEGIKSCLFVLFVSERIPSHISCLFVRIPHSTLLSNKSPSTSTLTNKPTLHNHRSSTAQPGFTYDDIRLDTNKTQLPTLTSTHENESLLGQPVGVATVNAGEEEPR
ncbi:hypothetical protein QCA50_020630 [Cerrena zonata]|uniref:Uncharacterized protein n=1 Tax=Cerrena zonata TaxID=2478898 RepID=A0AAW0FBU3_9APHY